MRFDSMPFPRLMPGFMLAFFLTVASAVTAATAVTFVPIPPLTSRVTDAAGMLNASQRAALENTLKEYESRTGSQIGILLVNSTEPEAIEQYSIRVAEAWKLGRKKVDDGVLLVVAKNNPKALRRLRIEAGRGVQGTLTDAQSKRILQDVIAPYFRNNDFSGGLNAGVAAITKLLDQEHLPAASKRNQGEESGSVFDLLLVPFFLLLIIGSIVGRFRRAGNRFQHDDWGNAAAGVILGGMLGGRSSGSRSGDSFSGGGGSFDGGGASGDW